MKVKDITGEGKFSDLNVTVIEAKEQEKNGSIRLTVTVGDNTGAMELETFWQSTEEDRKFYKTGSFVTLSGFAKISKYGGALKLNVTEKRVIAPEDVNYSDFVPSLTEEEIMENAKNMADRLAQIEGPFGEFARKVYYEEVVPLMPSKYGNIFDAVKGYRGALKHHHAKLGELCRHLIECDEIILKQDSFFKEYYNFKYDISLARAASFLSDVGKILDYVTSVENRSEIDKAAPEEEKYLVALEYDMGNNHIITGRDTVVRANAKYEILTPLQEIYLKTVIMMHHGDKGVKLGDKPVQPDARIPEAWIVSFADNISAHASKTESHQTDINKWK